MGSASKKMYFTTDPDEDYSVYHKPGEIVQTKFRLKVPHSSALSASLDFYPIDNLFRVCALKVTHIGRNYPCLVDPSSGPNTGVTPELQNNNAPLLISLSGQNSSTYYTFLDSTYGTKVKQINFDQIRNYGEKSPKHFW